MTSTIASERTGSVFTFGSSATWGAIFAGVIVALTVQSLLNLLGLGLGLVAFTPDASVAGRLGVGAMIWLFLSAIIALGIGGWVAGRLTDTNQSSEGALHGFITWSLVTLLTFIFMASTAGAVISGAVNVVGKSMVAAGKSVNQVAPQIGQTVQNILPDFTPAINRISQQAHQFIRSRVTQEENTAENQSNQQPSEQQLNQAIASFLTAVGEQDQTTARGKLIDILAQQGNMSRAEAEQTINSWQQTYNQLKEEVMQRAEEAKQQAKDVTEKASTVVGQFALIAFFVLLIGAIAASVGGSMGVSTRAPARY